MRRWSGTRRISISRSTWASTSAGSNWVSCPTAVPGTAGPQPLWGVASAVDSLARLVDLGAEVLDPVQDVGEGIRVAAVRDPFGNRLGIIENPHFKPGSVP